MNLHNIGWYNLLHDIPQATEIDFPSFKTGPENFNIWHTSIKTVTSVYRDISTYRNILRKLRVNDTCHRGFQETLPIKITLRRIVQIKKKICMYLF